MITLPIERDLPELRSRLREANRVVLSAPPGAGKTTRVPPSLLEEEWLRNGKIILLEPRRLAARRAAEFMASQLGEVTGKTIGYRIRGETKAGRATRIEVVTEGVLTRMIQDDPELPGVGCIMFDEFHERSLNADLGLALALDVQEHLREDLRLLVMSATLDGLRLSAVLPDAPFLESAGKSFQVETRYLSSPGGTPVELELCRKILHALDSDSGDILVFLPGRREIRRSAALLEEQALPPQIIIHQLFGEAGYRQQQAAVAPDPKGRRKVILSTSVAETSITIEGVGVVVDSGLARAARFNPRRGMTSLVTLPVSRAIAEQRRGRAGRLGPGICYRLWTERQHAELPAFAQPEILTADLAPLALDLARWGESSLRFIDPPPPAHLEQARTLLRDLGALDEQGKITSHGLEMANLPVHPRLAHMILTGNAMGMGRAACDLAALLEEREILQRHDAEEIDLAIRWRALQAGEGADRLIRQQIRIESRRLRRMLSDLSDDKEALGVLVALAYPERIAKRRAGPAPRYQLRGGTGARLRADTPLAREKYLAIAEADGAGSEARIFLASRVSETELTAAFGDAITVRNEVTWDSAREAVAARTIRSLGAIVLTEGKTRPEGDPARRAMTEGVRQMGLEVLPWTAEARSLQQRSEWLRRHGLLSRTWPEMSDAQLLATIDTWLPPHLGGVWQRGQLAELNMLAILRSLLPSGGASEVERLAPSHLRLPSGSRILLRYEETPILALKIQELFGTTETPRIGHARIPAVIHLLSPAGRPIAVTQDLRSFWSTAYPEIRTQLQARYPKHFWPADPLKAEPTNRTVRQMKRGRRR